MSFGPQSVRGKVMALAVAAALVPVLAVLSVLVIERSRIGKVVRHEMELTGRVSLANVSEGILSLCRAQDDRLRQQVEQNLVVARDYFRQAGGLNLSTGQVTWTAVNQFTGDRTQVVLPECRAGNTLLGQNRDRSVPTPVVDDVGRVTGATCTVFQRMNERGDMLRVATNVINKEGARGVGTYIPVTNADGKANPVLAAVLSGGRFTGRAFVVDRWYMTAYEPIRNASGQVAGMLFCGVPEEEAVAAVRTEVLKRRIGESGYVFVLHGSGDAKGQYIISLDGKRDGESLWEAQDAAGGLFIQKMIGDAVAASSGEMTFQVYPWKNQGEKTARDKIAACAYYEPWDWVIGASAYREEFDQAATVVAGSLQRLILLAIGLGILCCVGVILFGQVMVNRTVRAPLNRLGKAAEQLALGDVSVEIDTSGRDEISALAQSMSVMAEASRVQAESAEAVAQGNVDVERATACVRSEQDVLGQSMMRVCTNLSELIKESRRLTGAATDGQLAARGDAARFQGGFREIIEGVNATLDAVVGPLGMAASYVDRISKGDMPPKITDTYRGEFNAIRENLNACIDAIQALIADTQGLVESATSGNLAQRADASRHQGDFRRIVEGVNATLDAMVTPITEAAAILARVAERDLTARMEGNYRGDFARIKDSLNMAAANLDEALEQVATAVEQVASAAGQIGQGSQALAQGASEQASSLEEVGASLQEMASMTRQNAGNSQEARGLTETSRTGVQRGLESMQRLSEAMEKIKASSDATARIVKTIDEIAFQTNLLALNAAVEAARAGDAGKGFAVVAEEVRNLAMRSAEAAKSTAELIDESVHNAESGVALNQTVLGQLQEITGQTNQVGEVMGEIATASEQQSSGIEQITSAVEQMNQLTQQNAANSEESASAAEELSGQAEELRGLVAAFRLSRQATAAHSLAASRRRSEPRLRVVDGSAPPAERSDGFRAATGTDGQVLESF